MEECSGSAGAELDHLVSGEPPHTSRLSAWLLWLRQRARSPSALVLLGVGLLAGAFYLERRTIWPAHVHRRFDAESVTGLQRAGFSEPLILPGIFDLDEDTFRAEGQPIITRKFDQSRCVANILSAVFQLGDVGVTSVAANRDCSEARNLPSYVVPRSVIAAKESLDRVERLIREAQAGKGNHSKTLPGLLNKASILRKRVTDAKVLKESFHVRRHSGFVAPMSEVSAKLALENVERLVREAQASTGNSSGKFPGLTDLASSLRDKVSDAKLLEASHELHVAQAQIDDIPTPDNGLDFYSKKRLAQIRCARDALIISRSTALAAAKLSVAAGACPDKVPKQTKRNAVCGTQVAASISEVSAVGAEIDRLVLNCRPGLFDLSSCDNRLEALSWNIAAASVFLSRAFRVCQVAVHPGSKIFQPRSNRNAGWCIGEIFSSMGYIAASGLRIYQATHFDCFIKNRLLDLSFNRTLTARELRELQVFRARCARDYSAFVRIIFLGAVKAARAATHCGGTPEKCPRNIMRSASAFAGISQAGAQIAAACFVTRPFRGKEPPNVTAIREPFCVQESASLVKMLGVALSFLTDATGTCVGTKFAKTRCGASILRSLAALGALVEINANARINCNVRVDWFLCGRDMRFQGEALRVFVLAIASAALNCGLSPDLDQWNNTGPVAMPRFFTFP